MASMDVPPNIRTIDETLLYPRYPSGILENQDAIYRYGLRSSNYPILKIPDYISDYNGRDIKPGMYELALSDDKSFLLILQSCQLVAVLPVFKLAQNEEEVEKYRQEMLMQNKKLKPRKIKNKERMNAILRAKYAESAITPPDPNYVYMNATIEYIKEGGYYLVTYENGMYRAWGAIKTRNFSSKNPPDLRGGGNNVLKPSSEDNKIINPGANSVLNPG